MFDATLTVRLELAHKRVLQLLLTVKCRGFVQSNQVFTAWESRATAQSHSKDIKLVLAFMQYDVSAF